MTVRPKSVTLDDVARRAGVTKGTVSTVLNGARSNTKVSDATRTRIVTAAAELDYRPNAIARSLTHRKTDILGFYSGYPFITPRSVFLAELLTGFQSGCDEHEKDMLIHGAFPGHSAKQIYGELANGKIDGLILYSPVTDPLIELLADSYLPVVAVADPVPSLPSVGVDDAAGSRMLAEHLACRGHRRVLYRRSNHKAVSVERRRAAFLESAAELGMEVVAGYDQGDGHQPSELDKEALTGPPGRRATAVVGWTDRSAYAMVVYARQHGIRVPEELAIVGFNGLPSEFPLTMTLTTIRAPWADVAQTAVSLIVAQAAGKEVPQETLLPVELIHGDTT